MQITRMPRNNFPTAVLLLLACAACVGPILVYHQGNIQSRGRASQEEVVSSLRQLVGEMQQLATDIPAKMSESGGSDRTQWEELQSQFSQLHSELSKQVGQLLSVHSGLQQLSSGLQQQQQDQQELLQQKQQEEEEETEGAGGGAARGLMTERVAGEPSVVKLVDQKGYYLASPSILKLDSGRLLTVLERSVPWGMADTVQKIVSASDDGGVTWEEIATVGPMNWPQVFGCQSGVYIMGTQRHFSKDNNLVISKMTEPDGSKWSPVVQLTKGWSVVAANTGVDVSNGRVTKSFELIPSMSVPLTTTKILKGVQIPISGGPDGPSWRHQPVVDLEVEDTRGFIQYTLVKIPLERSALFFRVLEIWPDRRLLQLRLERFTLYWQQESVTLAANSTLQVSSGAFVYGGVDWVAMAMSADEGADLTNPASWVYADPPLGNPASIYTNEIRTLFDVAFRADKDVRKSIIGFDVKALDADPQDAWEAGFGSIYWMEGVITRLRDRHGGNNKLLSIMRVNNDLLCDLAALLEFDDTHPGRLTARFLRYTFVPGLGVGHPAILYDEESDLYWMASNVNRDATRKWKQPKSASEEQPNLHITLFSKCEVDRSTLALFYSPNMLNWVLAGVVDYHVTLGRHFAYPHMIVDGSDLLIVSRASMTPGTRARNATLNSFYNNHNSNAISMHRVKGFRQLANSEWALEQGDYSQHPRRVSS